MQEHRYGFRHGLAELTALQLKTASSVMRDLLPLLNLLVLLLPLVLLGVEFAARSAIAVTLPDTSPDVARLDTPPVPRRSTLGPDDHTQAVERQMPTRSTELPATSPSVFSSSPLGYGD